jgi:hypothetical protein
MSTEEQFIRRALEKVEKAEKFHRIRGIAIKVVALGTAVWLALKEPSPELNVECVVIIFTGLIAAICTSRIMQLINTSTLVVLQAISELKQSERT